MNKIIKKSQKIGYHKGERKANVAMADIYKKKEESLEVENIILDLMIKLSRQYFEISDYNKVSKLLEKAVLTIDKPSVSAETRCLFYINAASTNMELDKDNLKKSVEQFNTALEIAEKSKNHRFQMIALINLSILYGGIYKTDYNKAISYSKRVRSCNKRT